MLGRVDRVPGVTRHRPAHGCLFFQRIKVFRLGGQQADHLTPLEQPARVAFAHELTHIGGKQHVKDRIRLGVSQRLHHAARIDLAERRRLFRHEFDIRLLFLHQLLEGGDRRLSVFVIGIDNCPAFLVELERLGHQHRHLHIGGRAQAVGVSVAVSPHDLVGQRLGSQEEPLLLLGVIRQSQAHVRQKAAGEHVDLFARIQLLGRAHRVCRVAVVVADNQLELFASHAARLVDLLHRQFHALFVGLQKRRLRLVAVDLTDLDDVGSPCLGCQRPCRQRQRETPFRPLDSHHCHSPYH
ncbi:hypothetical protein SDC9_112805 [bioreactor metagenome]|uniref:Uncharacterized protein n=1 Tax=bioreactor metagenome TaxID=1076179 RepID=A0A645BMW8_9ZZZZ